MKGKRLNLAERCFVAILVAMVLSIVCSVVVVNKLSDRNSKNETMSIATMVSETLNNELLQPITVSKTLATNPGIKSYIKNSGDDPKSIEAGIAVELSDVLKKFGYNMIFVASEKNHGYYGCDGLVSILDTSKEDSHDAWYPKFIATQKPYELNIDTDEANNWDLSVFVNCRIEDDDKTLLGACGVAVNINRFKNVIETMEHTYNVKVRLVDNTGRIQVDSTIVDKDNRPYIDNIPFHKLDKENIYYEKLDNISRATKYIEDMDWYLVVEDSNPEKIDALQVVTPSIIILILSIMLIYAAFTVNNKESEERGKEISLGSLGSIYLTMHTINLETNEYRRIKVADDLLPLFSDFTGDGIQHRINEVIASVSVDEHRDMVNAFMDLSTLKERMKGRRSICCDFISTLKGWCRIRFILQSGDLQNPTEVVFAVENIEEYKQQEEKVLRESIHDDLTHTFNRKAYENDFPDKSIIPEQKGFTYISVDINGLKPVNDELGHQAGDELIAGAGQCLKQCVGSYGRVYRTGGDEFIAVIYASPSDLKKIRIDLKEVVDKWHGELVDSLAISYGIATSREFPDYTIDQLIEVADKRMYDAKARYYQKKGLDKRGLQAAYMALCNSYIKVLKVDLTADSYVPIQVRSSEQNEDSGYDTIFSRWVTQFANSGMVHKDDIKLFLNRMKLTAIREYFRTKNINFIHTYRRRHNDDYAYVMLEMVPTKEYTDDRQIVYLYIKDLSEDRRISDRFTVEKAGELSMTDETGSLKKLPVTVHDISDTGVSFSIEAAQELPSGKYTLECSDSIDDKEFNMNMDCSIIHCTKYKNGTIVYGSSIVNRNEDVRKYITYKKINKMLEEVEMK